MFSKCPGPKAHVQQWKCHKGIPLTCTKCERESKLAQKRQEEDFTRQQKLDEDQRVHDLRMAEIDAEIAQCRDKLRNTQLAEERQFALEQKKKDLELARAQTATANSAPSNPKTKSGNTATETKGNGPLYRLRENLTLKYT